MAHVTTVSSAAEWSKHSTVTATPWGKAEVLPFAYQAEPAEGEPPLVLGESVPTTSVRGRLCRYVAQATWVVELAEQADEQLLSAALEALRVALGRKDALSVHATTAALRHALDSAGQRAYVQQHFPAEIAMLGEWVGGSAVVAALDGDAVASALTAGGFHLNRTDAELRECLLRNAGDTSMALEPAVALVMAARTLLAPRLGALQRLLDSGKWEPAVALTEAAAAASPSDAAAVESEEWTAKLAEHANVAQSNVANLRAVAQERAQYFRAHLAAGHPPSPPQLKQFLGALCAACAPMLAKCRTTTANVFYDGLDRIGWDAASNANVASSPPRNDDVLRVLDGVVRSLDALCPPPPKANEPGASLADASVLVICATGGREQDLNRMVEQFSDSLELSKCAVSPAAVGVDEVFFGGQALPVAYALRCRLSASDAPALKSGRFEKLLAAHMAMAVPNFNSSALCFVSPTAAAGVSAHDVSADAGGSSKRSGVPVVTARKLREHTTAPYELGSLRIWRPSDALPAAQRKPSTLPAGGAAKLAPAAAAKQSLAARLAPRVSDSSATVEVPSAVLIGSWYAAHVEASGAGLHIAALLQGPPKEMEPAQRAVWTGQVLHAIRETIKAKQLSDCGLDLDDELPELVEGGRWALSATTNARAPAGGCGPLLALSEPELLDHTLIEPEAEGPTLAAEEGGTSAAWGLDLAQLKVMDEAEARQQIGEALYTRITPHNPMLSSKLTGMLLTEPLADLLGYLDDTDSLRVVVNLGIQQLLGFFEADAHIKKLWASAWADSAYAAREAAGVGHTGLLVEVAVCKQPAPTPEGTLGGHAVSAPGGTWLSVGTEELFVDPHGRVEEVDLQAERVLSDAEAVSIAQAVSALDATTLQCRFRWKQGGALALHELHEL